MNRIRVVVLSIVMSLLVMSCDKQYQKLQDHVWNQDESLAFNVSIEDNTKPYQLMIGLRHHYALQVESIGVDVEVLFPSKKKEVRAADVMLRDGEGKPLGNCAGDLCDLENTVVEGISFDEVGEYVVTVRHHEGGQIPGIMEVGVIVDPQEKK